MESLFDCNTFSVVSLLEFANILSFLSIFILNIKSQVKHCIVFILWLAITIRLFDADFLKIWFVITTISFINKFNILGYSASLTNEILTLFRFFITFKFMNELEDVSQFINKSISLLFKRFILLQYHLLETTTC